MSDRPNGSRDVRARAEERAHREFIAPSELPPAAERQAAEARLRDALEREIGVPLGESAAASGPEGRIASHRPPRTPLENDLSRILRLFVANSWRPAIAVVAVVAGTWFYGVMLEKKAPPAMRGPAAELQEGELGVFDPESRADGTVRLAWSPAREADRYDVVFQSPDLNEIARTNGVAATELILTPTSLPPGLRPGAHVLYHVVALRGPDELARSRTVSLTVPSR